MTRPSGQHPIDPPDPQGPEAVAAIQEVKDAGKRLLDVLVRQPPCRQNSLAITKTEEAIMWATRGICAVQPSGSEGHQE